MITGLYSHTHAHTCTATQIYDLKSGYVGGPGLLKSHEAGRGAAGKSVRRKQHAYLLFGFTLARANARMLINAASKRSSAKNAVRTSRSRST